jgi:hypothetical protein
MGEGANRLNSGQRQAADELEGEIGHIRSRLGRSLDELDRRRHELTNIKLQVRKHPVVVIAAGLFLLSLAGGVVYAIWTARRHPDPFIRARKLRRAVSRMVDEPDRVARSDPSVREKVLAALGGTVATMMAKQLLGRAFGRGAKQPA